MRNDTQVDFNKLFTDIILEPLKNSFGDEPNWITFTSTKETKMVYTDAFIAKTLIQDILFLALKLNRSNSTDKMLEVSISVDPHHINPCINFKVSYNVIAPLDKSILSSITKLTAACEGSINSGIDKNETKSHLNFQYECLWFPIDLIESKDLSKNELDNNSIPNDNNNKTDKREKFQNDFFEFNTLVASILVNDVSYFQSSMYIFEKAGFECRELPSFNDSLKTDILIIDDQNMRKLSKERSFLQFKGLIVLFTGQNNYSDYNREFTGFKFILLPYPCLYSDAVHVKDYYLNVHNLNKNITSEEMKSTKFKASHISSFIQNIIHTVSSSSGVVFIRYCFNILSTKQEKRNVLGKRYNYERRNLLMNLFSKEVEKDLYTWVLVNPNKTFFNFHVSTLLDTMLISLFFYRLITYLMCKPQERNVRALISVISLLFLAYFRVSIAKIFRMEFSFYWYLLGVLTIINQIISYIVLLLKCENFSCKPYMPSDMITAENLDEWIYIGNIGFWLTINLISLNFQSNLFGWGIFFPWPINLFYNLTCNFASCFLIYYSYARLNIDYKFYLFIWLVEIHSLITFFITCYKSEYWHRDIFQIIEQNKYGINFINNSTKEFWEEISIPISSLLSTRTVFLERVKSVLLKSPHILSEELVDSLKNFHSGVLLQKMIFDQGSLVFGNGISDSDRFEEDSIIILEEELNYIGKAFRVSNQFSIELYTKIDPQLAIIKTNRYILRTLIVNMINIANKNIAADIFNNASNRKVFHEITIMAKLSSSNQKNSEKQPSQVMEIMVLDTGCQSKNANKIFSSFSKMMCHEISKQVQGTYQAKSINHIDIKNIQKCVLSYESINRPVEMFSANESKFINTYKISKRAIQMIKCINNHEFKVLIFETDKFMLNQVSNQIEMYGWQTYLISSLEELLKFKEMNSVGLVLIDDNANKRIISNSKIDVAKCIRFMGHPFAIVSLTSTLGQKPSSPFFTDSLAKPIVDTSIVKLKKMVLDVLYAIALSLEKNI